MKNIPVNFSSPDFSMQVELDGVVYGLRFIYNERSKRFSLSISTEAGEPIVSGIFVVSNYPLLARFRDLRLPKGVLFTMDTTSSGLEPDADSFGDAVLLVYATEAEVAAL